MVSVNPVQLTPHSSVVLPKPITSTWGASGPVEVVGGRKGKKNYRQAIKSLPDTAEYLFYACGLVNFEGNVSNV